MPDVLVAAAAAPVTAPIPVTATEPQPPQNIVGQLKGDDPILVRGKDGNVQTTKLSDLADAWRNRVDTADMDDLVLMRKALKEGDAAAAQQLVTKYSTGGNTGGTTPATPVPPVVPVSPELAAMQKEFAEMKAMMASIAPTANTVQEAMELQQLTGVIDAVKDKVPFLIKHPERAQLVRVRLGYYADLAKSQNLQLSALPLDVRQKVTMKAMEDVDASLKQTVGYYGATAGNGATGPNVTSINDQNRNTTPGIKEPRYKIVNGQMIDTTQPPAVTTVAAALPTAPVTPVPSGGMVGVNGAEVKPSRMSGQQMMESMRARAATLAGTV